MSSYTTNLFYFLPVPYQSAKIHLFGFFPLQEITYNGCGSTRELTHPAPDVGIPSVCADNNLALCFHPDRHLCI
jgi:hypothetical protein